MTKNYRPKPFDKYLYEKNDKIAKDITIKAFLNNYGYNLEENPDIYGPDLKAYEDGKFIGYVETEIKYVWKDGLDRLPYETLHIPERKSRLLKYANRPNERTPIVFCVLANDLKAGFWIDGETLSECPIITKSNIYIDREDFFEIHLSKVNYFFVEPKKTERDNNESVESQSSK